MLKLARSGQPLKVVDDQRGTPACQGETTWHGFADEIFHQEGLSVNLSPCRTEDFPRPAPRPAYSVLSGDRRRELGGDVMPEWKTALSELHEKGEAQHV